MSVERTRYVICGYDLSKYRSSLLTKEFQNSDLYEEYTSYQTQGFVQAFTDPMCGEYLYFGMVMANIDDDEDDKVFHISSDDFQSNKLYIDYKIQQIGWAQNLLEEKIPYEVIVFTECY